MARPIRGRVPAGPAIPPELVTFDVTDWPVDESGSAWADLVTIAGPVHARDILAQMRWNAARRAWLLEAGYDRSIFRDASAIGAESTHTMRGRRT